VFAANVTLQQSGSHTLRIQQREDGASVDQILLSPAAYLVRRSTTRRGSGRRKRRDERRADGEGSACG
jgi:hypothetical protein